MDWISVKDSLPEDLPENAGKKSIKVLVAIKERYGYCVRSQTRLFDSWYERWEWKYAAGSVTHWAKMPDPPTDEDRE